MKIAILLVCLVLGACTPYTAQLRGLDKAYKTGQIPPAQYYALRNEVMMAEQQWGRNVAASLNQTSANIQQANYQQQQINAYNLRTQAIGFQRLPSPTIPIVVPRTYDGTIYLPDGQSARYSGTSY